MKDELVDLLDKNGNLTGKSLLKSEVHKQGLWHGAAHIWIYNSQGQILLQKRHPNKIVWPNVWDVAVAGHIAAGEKPKQTGVKEAQEELQLKLRPDKLEFIGLNNFEDPTPPDNWMHRVFIWSYLLKQNLDINDLVLEEGETSEVRWVDYEKLEAEINDPALAYQFSPNSKKLFEQAIAAVRKNLNT